MAALGAEMPRPDASDLALEAEAARAMGAMRRLALAAAPEWTAASAAALVGSHPAFLGMGVEEVNALAAQVRAQLQARAGPTVGESALFEAVRSLGGAAA